jgi:hypothetical protein
MRGAAFWPARINGAQNKFRQHEREIEKNLAIYTASVGTIDSNAAAALVSQIQGLAAETESGIKSNETKANTILGFLGGGLSLVALFTGSRPDSIIAAPVILAAAVICFLGALIASVCSLYSYRKRGIPELDRIQQAIESGAFGEGLFYAYLARSWRLRYSELRVTSARKAQLIEITQMLFAAGTICVVASFCFSALKADRITVVSTHSLVQCSADPRSDLGHRFALSCTRTTGAN